MIGAIEGVKKKFPPILFRNLKNFLEYFDTIEFNIVCLFPIKISNRLQHFRRFCHYFHEQILKIHTNKLRKSKIILR